MPWELGYFDGFRPSFVWILPLVDESDSEYKGQEYLGLYPPVEKLSSLAGRMNYSVSFVSLRIRRGIANLAWNRHCC
jgi:hypothetical protein